MCLGSRRIAQPPHRHILSTKTKTGILHRETAPEKSGTPVCSLAQSRDRCLFVSLCFSLLPRKHRKQLQFQPTKFKRCNRACRMDHNIPSRSKFFAVQSQDLSHAPSNSIAHHRASQRLLDAHPEAISWQAISPRENHKIRSRTAPALPINSLIFRPSQQSPFPRQIALLRWLIRGLGSGHKRC